MRFTATLLTYGEDSSPGWFGDVVTFAEGSLYQGADNVALLVEHDTRREVAGRALSVWVEDGVVRGEFETLDNPAGRSVEAELSAGVRMDVSVGVLIEDSYAEPLDPEDSSWFAPLRETVTSADLVETSTCLRGRMPSARVESITTPTDEGTAA